MFNCVVHQTCTNTVNYTHGKRPEGKNEREREIALFSDIFGSVHSSDRSWLSEENWLVEKDSKFGPDFFAAYLSQ